MITPYPFRTLGTLNTGWLHARYHFSFANYYNPTRMGFGTLRVINDDRVEAGKGFAPHSHENMEIITYVREGAIHHRDSLGNEGVTQAGDVQVMSAGTGITHSEHAGTASDTRLYQIWIEPNQHNIVPRWEQAAFPKSPVHNQLPLLVSGYGRDANKGALWIAQEAAVSGGRLTPQQSITQVCSDAAYILISKGAVEINGTRLEQGDGAESSGETSLIIKALEEAEVLVIDVGSFLA
jgi:redox-sensitive bicupin YhaK (pirin superfamily)